MTRGHNSTLSYDPGSQFNVELWPSVKIPRWIMTRVLHWIVIQIPGHNLTLNHVSWSQFNVKLKPAATIQRWIKTGSRFNGGFQILSVGGVIIQWPPVSGEGVGIPHEKICSILSTARWVKTPWVEIQWGQNSILHRRSETLVYKHEGWLIINMFFSGKEKKEEIRLIPMSKAPSSTEKHKTQRDNTKMQPKPFVSQRMRTDFGRSVGVTTATQLVWLNRLMGSQPSH